MKNSELVKKKLSKALQVPYCIGSGKTHPYIRILQELQEMSEVINIMDWLNQDVSYAQVLHDRNLERGMLNVR